VATFAEAAARQAGLAAWLLGWRPDDFWRATPAELAVAAWAAVPTGGGGAVGVTTAELARLRKLFPD